jgi:hypothetical protein
MNTRAKKVLLFSALILMAFSISTFFIVSNPRRARVNGDKITAATHAYCRNAMEHDKNLPTSISLNDLMAKGYLKHNDASSFDGLKVTVHLNPYDTNPQSALMSARLPDGNLIVALADGSVQAFVQ